MEKKMVQERIQRSSNNCLQNSNEFQQLSFKQARNALASPRESPGSLQQASKQFEFEHNAQYVAKNRAAMVAGHIAHRDVHQGGAILRPRSTRSQHPLRQLGSAPLPPWAAPAFLGRCLFLASVFGPGGRARLVFPRSLLFPPRPSVGVSSGLWSRCRCSFLFPSGCLSSCAVPLAPFASASPCVVFSSVFSLPFGGLLLSFA